MEHIERQLEQEDRVEPISLQEAREKLGSGQVKCMEFQYGQEEHKELRSVQKEHMEFRFGEEEYMELRSG